MKKKSNFEKKLKKKEKKEKKKGKVRKKTKQNWKKNKKKGKVTKKKGKESLWITVVIHSEMCVGGTVIPPHHLDYVLMFWESIFYLTIRQWKLMLIGKPLNIIQKIIIMKG